MSRIAATLLTVLLCVTSAEAATYTKIVGTATELSGFGTHSWTNLANVTADDGVNATCTNTTAGYSEYVAFTMAGNEFAIPADERVIGVVVKPELQSGANNAWEFSDIHLTVDGEHRIGRDFRGPVPSGISSTMTLYSRGDAWQDWGTPLTAAAVNSPNFGVIAQFRRPTNGVYALNIDHVTIEVTTDESQDDIVYDDDFDAAICIAQPPSHDAGELYRITAPGLGTPKAILTFGHGNRPEVVYSPTANTTRITAHHPMIGMGTSSTARANTLNNFGNRLCSQNEILRASASNSTDDIDSLGTDYVQVVTDGPLGNTGDRVGNNFYLAVLLGGDDFDAKTVVQNGLNGSTGQSVTVTGLGFEPNCGIGQSGLELYSTGGHVMYTGQEWGFFTNPGSGNENVTQIHSTIEAEIQQPNLLIATEPMHWLGSEYLHEHYDFLYSTVYKMKLQDFTSGGFTIQASGANGNGDDGLVILAMRTNRQVACGFWQTPEGTGAQEIDLGINFRPHLVILKWSKAKSTGSAVFDTVDGEIDCTTIITPRQVAATGYAARYHSGPTGRQGETWITTNPGGSKRIVDAKHGDGTPLWVGDLVSRDVGGLTVNMTTNDEPDCWGTFFAIGEAQ